MTNLRSDMRVQLHPPKDLQVDLHIKAFVGHKTSSQFHVFELTRQLPRFSMYALVTDDDDVMPTGSVTFQITERINRVMMTRLVLPVV